MTAMRRSQIDHNLGGLVSISVTVGVRTIINAESEHHTLGIATEKLIHHSIVMTKCRDSSIARSIDPIQDRTGYSVVVLRHDKIQRPRDILQ